jgi:Virulence factor
MSTLYQIVYWRDIPAQVKVRAGKQRLARPLSPRFQDAIDEAAMLARATSTDAYLEDWRTTEWAPGQDDPEQVAASLVADLESAYPPERLEALKVQKGYEGK